MGKVDFCRVLRFPIFCLCWAFYLPFLVGQDASQLLYHKALYRCQEFLHLADGTVPTHSGTLTKAGAWPSSADLALHGQEGGGWEARVVGAGGEQDTEHWVRMLAAGRAGRHWEMTGWVAAPTRAVSRMEEAG